MRTSDRTARNCLPSSTALDVLAVRLDHPGRKRRTIQRKADESTVGFGVLVA